MNADERWPVLFPPRDYATRRLPEDVRKFQGSVTVFHRGRSGIDPSKIPTLTPGPAYSYSVASVKCVRRAALRLARRTPVPLPAFAYAVPYFRDRRGGHRAARWEAHGVVKRLRRWIDSTALDELVSASINPLSDTGRVALAENGSPAWDSVSPPRPAAWARTWKRGGR